MINLIIETEVCIHPPKVVLLINVMIVLAVFPNNHIITLRDFYRL